MPVLQPGPQDIDKGVQGRFEPVIALLVRAGAGLLENDWPIAIKIETRSSGQTLRQVSLFAFDVTHYGVDALDPGSGKIDAHLAPIDHCPGFDLDPGKRGHQRYIVRTKPFRRLLLGIVEGHLKDRSPPVLEMSLAGADWLGLHRLDGFRSPRTRQRFHHRVPISQYAG